MNRAIPCLLAGALVLSAGSPAWARDAKGKIKSYDTRTQVIEFEDGSQYIVTDKVKTIEKIQVGKQVKVTYDERDGKNLVSELEEVESP